jgi:hypothetical protein
MYVTLWITAVLYTVLAFADFTQEYPRLEWNKKSTLSTDSQVEFPGIVLEPDTYIVRLSDGGEHRSIVEITNKDETQVLATVAAVPDHRLRPDDNSEFTFHQLKHAGPRPVQSWFFAGDLVGLEFVYPKTRAKEIAKESDSRVMASNGMKAGVIIAVTANGKEVVIDDQATGTARTKPQ